MHDEPVLEVNALTAGGVLAILVAAVALWGAEHGVGSWGVWLFPRFAAGALVVFGLLLAAQGLRKRERALIWSKPEERRDVLAFAGTAVAYAAVVAWLGFWLATALLVAGVASAFGEDPRPGRIAAWAAGGLLVGFTFDALFVGVFGVPLPGGALWGGALWRPWLP